MEKTPKKLVSKKEFYKIKQLRALKGERLKLYKLNLNKVGKEIKQSREQYLEERTELYKRKLSADLARFDRFLALEMRRAKRINRRVSTGDLRNQLDRENVQNQIGALLKGFKATGSAFTLNILEYKDPSIYRAQYRYVCNTLVTLGKLVIVKKGRGNGNETVYGFPGVDYTDHPSTKSLAGKQKYKHGKGVPIDIDNNTQEQSYGSPAPVIKAKCVAPKPLSGPFDVNELDAEDKRTIQEIAADIRKKSIEEDNDEAYSDEVPQ